MLASRPLTQLHRFPGFAAIVCALTLGAATFLPATQAQAQEDQAVSQVRAGNMAQARAIFGRRSMPGHFTAMNADKRGGVSMREMDTYFMAMHIAHDQDRNGIVSVPEAPRILLRYKLSGQPFPPQGLTQAELRGRLQNLFSKVDKNRNGELSWLELLQ